MHAYAAIMLIAGIGIPILAALNAELGKTIGSPAAAAFVLFLVAILTTGAVVLVTGTEAFGNMATAPRHLFLGARWWPFTFCRSPISRRISGSETRFSLSFWGN